MDDITRPSAPSTPISSVPPTPPVTPTPVVASMTDFTAPVVPPQTVSIPVDVATAPTVQVPVPAPAAVAPAMQPPAPTMMPTPPTPVAPEVSQPAVPAQDSGTFAPVMDPALETAVPATPAEVPRDASPATEETNAKVSAAPATSAPKRKGGRASIIILAVLIALALIAGAGYAYWTNNKSVKETSSSQTSTVETPKITPATTDDVDKAIKDIDASLKAVDDANEYQATDLTDATLGL